MTCSNAVPVRDLFAGIDPRFQPRRPTKKERREQRERVRLARAAIDDWAAGVLLFEVAVGHERIVEGDVVNAMGSGPPDGWRDRLCAILRDELPRLPEQPSNVQLLKGAVQLGRLSKSIWEKAPAEAIAVVRAGGRL